MSSIPLFWVIQLWLCFLAYPHILPITSINVFRNLMRCVHLGGYYGEGWRAADGGPSHFLIGLGEESTRDSKGQYTK
jgi:hypothetical protein